MTIGQLAVLAAVLQLAGYALYTRLFLQRRIRPNAASWLMFGYGTALMVALEYSGGATWHLLALPVACSAASVAVALLCIRRRATDPVDKVEATAFYADIFLSFFYAILAFGYGDFGPYAAGFVIAGNVTTMTAFFPVLRSTWRNPERELPGPWIVWTIAYGLLTAVTLTVDKGANPALFVYPVLSLALHGAVAIMSLVGSVKRRYVDAAETVYLAPSGLHGTGMFAGVRFDGGTPIWKMTGHTVFGAITESGPNFIGLGPDVWIDPELPLDHINHCCEPNAAFGSRRRLYAINDIFPGEEIVLDYSTTEADTAWTMQCKCGSQACRGTLRAIHLAFDTLPMASPLMRLVWQSRRNASVVPMPNLVEVPLPARGDPSPGDRRPLPERVAPRRPTRRDARPVVRF